MSEYWKSTPKYWCKFCETYVKDTKLEKQQHEATGRHQGSVQRHLRNVHKTQDREEREKQRAKDEVARLNGLVSGQPVATNVAKSTPSFTRTPARQATAEDRKKQMESLAAMGIAVPEEYRKEMNMVGDWHTVEEKVVSGDVKPNVQSIGIQKRKREDGEGEEDGDLLASAPQRKTWGSRLKTTSTGKSGDLDFDALMQSGPAAASKARDDITENSEGKEAEPKIKHEPDADEDSQDASGLTVDVANVKKEDGDEASTQPAAPVFFKKRKGKSAKV